MRFDSPSSLALRGAQVRALCADLCARLHKCLLLVISRKRCISSPMYLPGAAPHCPLQRPVSGPAAPVLGAPLGISDQLRRGKGAMQVPPKTSYDFQQQVLTLLAGITSLKVIVGKGGPAGALVLPRAGGRPRIRSVAESLLCGHKERWVSGAWRVRSTCHCFVCAGSGRPACSSSAPIGNGNHIHN